jgi:membrane protein implicated in regulation of membrane protease activity
MNLFSSTQTLIYLSIALASFVAVGGTFLFGHDTDHDMGHDLGHDHEIGLFSPKIIFSFTLGFGAAGTIASAYGLRPLWCVLSGSFVGFILSLAAYGIMAIFYKQQSSSVIPTAKAVGRVANVTSAIPDNGVGEVGLDVLGQYQIYLARSGKGTPIPKGARVKVVENQGGELVVEPEVGI